jgi:hypothetical protein
VTSHITESVAIAASPETVFAAMTDWARQGEWMLATKVRVRIGDGASVGSELVAVTGYGPFVVADTMRITRWDPPINCDVEHTGMVVRGTGTFEVRPRGRHGSAFVWSEQLDPPLGAVGRVGWRGAQPAVRWGLRKSLQRFARFCESYRP